jgi:spore germination protein KA
LGTFIRWIRFLALFLSISLSPLYVLLTSFHQEMLPTALALKIAAGRSGVPFPAFIEAFLMEIILEIMKEAGLRMPKPLGQTVSIVGTLVIGQAAVTAGLVSPLMVIIIAVAAISSYAIPAFNMSNSLRLLRFPLLILSALFGLLGYLAGLIVISLHLMSLRSFGTPYLAPVIPLNRSSATRDVFTRAPWWQMIKRSGLARPQEQTRQTSDDLKPKPPRK